jgi:histidine ammonia-lyase
MIAQYAGAARAAESRVLSMPASVMSISTSANQEDFVSMSSIGALHLRKVIHNLEIVIAVELLCALRSIQFSLTTSAQQSKEAAKYVRHLGRLGTGTKLAFEILDQKLPRPRRDRYMRADIEAVVSIIRSGELVSRLGKQVAIEPV